MVAVRWGEAVAAWCNSIGTRPWHPCALLDSRSRVVRLESQQRREQEGVRAAEEGAGIGGGGSSEGRGGGGARGGCEGVHRWDQHGVANGLYLRCISRIWELPLFYHRVSSTPL